LAPASGVAPDGQHQQAQGTEQRAEVEQLRADQAGQGREAERRCADALRDQIKVVQVAAAAAHAAASRTSP
jgi:hypothetical protein